MEREEVYKFAETEDEINKALALMQAIYKKEVRGNIDGISKGQRLIIAIRNETLIGAMRIIEEPPYEIEDFIDINKLYRDKKTIEVGRLAVLPEYRFKSMPKRILKRIFTESSFLDRIRNFLHFIFFPAKRQKIMFDNNVSMGFFSFLYRQALKNKLDVILMTATERKRKIYELVGGKVIGHSRRHKLTQRVVYPMACDVKEFKKYYLNYHLLFTEER